MFLLAEFKKLEIQNGQGKYFNLKSVNYLLNMKDGMKKCKDKNRIILVMMNI